VIFTGQLLSNRIAMRAVWKQARANIVHAQGDNATGPIVLRGVTVRYGRRTALVGVSGEFPPAVLPQAFRGSAVGRNENTGGMPTKKRPRRCRGLATVDSASSPPSMPQTMTLRARR
jgi:hypothetical protein